MAARDEDDTNEKASPCMPGAHSQVFILDNKSLYTTNYISV